jgi:hypothetical protein
MFSIAIKLQAQGQEKKMKKQKNQDENENETKARNVDSHGAKIIQIWRGAVVDFDRKHESDVEIRRERVDGGRDRMSGQD